MTIQKYLGTASVAATLAFGFAGSAFASDVTLDSTGPDSTQTVVIDNSSEVTVHNTNTLYLSNTNTQTATTGNVDAEDNTSVEGPLQSGDATNNNTTDTSVTVSNDAVTPVPVGGNGNGGNGNGGNGGNGGSVGGSGSNGGTVLGAATVGGFGGGAVLPAVGAQFPVDVSALRAAWHPQTNATTTALAKGSRMFTAAMLITATLLSLLGALGSAFYARRRQERV